MMKFPQIHNNAEPEIAGGNISFSYLSSLGEAKTETKPMLAAKSILDLVKARYERFKSQIGKGARESEASRSERKYISAHPASVLKAAWNLSEDDLKMELMMMLDESSHSGISDPVWLQENAKPQTAVIGDDGKPLGKSQTLLGK